MYPLRPTSLSIATANQTAISSSCNADCLIFWAKAQFCHTEIQFRGRLKFSWCETLYVLARKQFRVGLNFRGGANLVCVWWLAHSVISAYFSRWGMSTNRSCNRMSMISYNQNPRSPSVSTLRKQKAVYWSQCEKVFQRRLVTFSLTPIIYD